MNFTELPLDRQIAIEKKYPDLNFFDHFYEFDTNDELIEAPSFKDRYGVTVKLDDICVVIQSAGSNRVRIRDCTFVGYDMLRKDGFPRQKPMIVFKDSKYPFRIEHRDDQFHNIIIMNGRLP